jgi:hypothetical protein
MKNKLNKDGFITIGMENIMASIEEVALFYRCDITDGGQVNMKPSEQYNANAMDQLNLAAFYNSSGAEKTWVQGKNVQMASSNQMLQSISTNLPFHVFTGLPSTWKLLTTVESLVKKMELHKMELAST